MEATPTTEARRQRLIEKAARRNMKRNAYRKRSNAKSKGKAQTWLELASGRTNQPISQAC